MIASHVLNHRLHARPSIGPITESARFRYFNQILSERWPRPVRVPYMLDLSGDAGFLAEMFSGLGFRVIVADGLEEPAEPRQKYDAVCCCDRLEHRDDWPAVVGRVAPIVRSGGILFYSVVGRPRPSDSVFGRLREWFGAPPRDYAITATDLTATLGQEGFRVRAVVGLGYGHGDRAGKGPVSYMGYAFRRNDRAAISRSERRFPVASVREWSALPRQARGWSIRVQHPRVTGRER